MRNAQPRLAAASVLIHAWTDEFMDLTLQVHLLGAHLKVV